MQRKPVNNIWYGIVFYAIIFEIVVWAATGSWNPLEFIHASIGIIVVCSIILLLIVQSLVGIAYLAIIVPNKQCDCGCGNWFRSIWIYVYGFPTPCQRNSLISTLDK